MSKNTPKDQLSDNIDSPKDRESMKNEDIPIQLPDVNEIPGQEFISPAPTGQLSDTTISSSDEEGEGIFDTDSDSNDDENMDSQISQQEKKDLETAANDMPGDDENLREAGLDNSDEEGTTLNEGSFQDNLSASDLDIPGADLDDEDEDIGEEDEENNDYSLEDQED